eukprot:761524-Hanusia_phi.AAC.1
MHRSGNCSYQVQDGEASFANIDERFKRYTSSFTGKTCALDVGTALSTVLNIVHRPSPFCVASIPFIHTHAGPEVYKSALRQMPHNAAHTEEEDQDRSSVLL